VNLEALVLSTIPRGSLGREEINKEEEMRTEMEKKTWRAKKDIKPERK
jgi:hypothetical protein